MIFTIILVFSGVILLGAIMKAVTFGVNLKTDLMLNSVSIRPRKDRGEKIAEIELGSKNQVVQWLAPPLDKDGFVEVDSEI